MKFVEDPGRTRIAATPALAALAAIGLSLPVHADNLLPGSGVTLVSGSSSQTVPFQLSTSGTLTVTLENLPLAQRLDSLSFMVSTSTSALTCEECGAATWTPVLTTDTESFAVGPGTYFAHIQGQAGGSLDLGIYALYVSFTPNIPLPASGWMLVTGVFVLIGLARVTCTYKPFEGDEPGAGSAPA
jgi:hypothetical protein